MRQQNDDHGGDCQHQHCPSASATIAKASKNGITDSAGQKEPTESDACLPRIVPPGILQEERAEAAHARARKIAQTERHCGEHKEKPKRAGREKLVWLALLVRSNRNWAFVICQPKENSRGHQPKHSQFEDRSAP